VIVSGRRAASAMASGDESADAAAVSGDESAGAFATTAAGENASDGP
jgi:hypothetical protein